MKSSVWGGGRWEILFLPKPHTDSESTFAAFLDQVLRDGGKSEVWGRRGNLDPIREVKRNVNRMLIQKVGAHITPIMNLMVPSATAAMVYDLHFASSLLFLFPMSLFVSSSHPAHTSLSL